jgi:hypothetical protein
MSNKLKLDKRVIKETASNILSLDNIIEIYSADTIDKKVENATDSKLNVLKDLAAEGVDETTTAILEYGVSVFTTITQSDYCAKLPQPVTGKSAKIINKGAMPLALYPSNIGGQINNLSIDAPAIIPNDGKLYEFICIENPLPGAWVWSAPAVGQYDSGEITANNTGGFTGVITAIDPAHWTENAGFYATTGWAYSAQFSPLQIFGDVPPNGEAVFRDTINWNAVSKVKVYTNLVSGPGLVPTYGLMYSKGISSYDPTTNAFVNFYSTTAGNYFHSNAGAYASCDLTIPGGILTTGDLAPNIGDPGTCYGEQDYSVGGGIGGATFVGLENIGPNATTGDIEWKAGYIGFNISPGLNLTGLKFRFIIEYY